MGDLGTRTRRTLGYVLLCLSFFMTGFEFSVGGVSLSVAQVPIILLLPVVLKTGKVFQKSLWIAVVGIWGAYFAYTEFGGAFNEFRFIHQLLGLILTINVAYLLSRKVERTLGSYVKVYFLSGVAVGALGLVEELAYLSGFQIPVADLIPGWQAGGFSNGVLRISSLQGEPTHLAATLLPVVVLGLYLLCNKRAIILPNKTVERLMAAVPITAFILTFSTTGYGALFLLGLIYWAVSLEPRQLAKRVIIGFVIVGAFGTAYLGSTAVRERVRFGDTPQELLRQKSTLALVSNLWLAGQILVHHPLVGAGIGNNPVAFQKYVLSEVPQDIEFYNQVSGASLILRYLNEGGVLLLMLMLWIICQDRVRFVLGFERIVREAHPGARYLVVFKYATIAGILAYFIRRGVYVELNFWMLVFLGRYRALGDRILSGTNVSRVEPAGRGVSGHRSNVDDLS